MATKAKVKEEAAHILGILRPGQSLVAPYILKIEEYWDETYDELKEEELDVFPTAGPVPDRLKPHLAVLIAMKGAETFGIPDARYMRLVTKQGAALREIRKHVQPKYESETEQEDY